MKLGTILLRLFLLPDARLLSKITHLGGAHFCNCFVQCKKDLGGVEKVFLPNTCVERVLVECGGSSRQCHTLSTSELLQKWAKMWSTDFLDGLLVQLLYIIINLNKSVI